MVGVGFDRPLSPIPHLAPDPQAFGHVQHEGSKTHTLNVTDHHDVDRRHGEKVYAT
jgi:hypothetical protein